jgi:hypothetical protein
MTPTTASARLAGIAIACAAALAAIQPATAGMIDVPAGPGDAQGPAPFRFYGTGGSRVQQFYDGGLFGSSAQTISALAFRTAPGAVPSIAFGNSVSISDVTIRLSTTAAGGEGPNQASSSFADNIGADVTTVFQGALTLTTLSPGSFDYLVTFATPFTFDPLAGNLLLDVAVASTATVSGNGLFGFLTFDQVNMVNDGVASVLDIFDGTATSGQFSTAGTITRFFADPVAVPEPMSLALLGAGLCGLGLMRRCRPRRA